MKIVSNIFAVELILSNKTFDALHLTYIGFFSLSVLCSCVCCTFFAALFFHSKQWSAITQTLSKSLTNYQLRKSLASKVTLKFIQANLIRDFNALEIIALFWKKRNKCKRESLNVITFESYLPFDNNKLKYLTMIIMSELRHPSL